jgi:hypothetical protein
MHDSPSPVRLVVFDAGGVIVRIRPGPRHTSFAALRRIGCRLKTSSYPGSRFSTRRTTAANWSRKSTTRKWLRSPMVAISADVRRIHAAVSAEEFAGVHTISMRWRLAGWRQASFRTRTSCTGSGCPACPTAAANTG